MNKWLLIVIIICMNIYNDECHSAVYEELMNYALKDHYFILLDIGYFPIQKDMFLNTKEDAYLKFSSSAYLESDWGSDAAEFSIKNIKQIPLDKSYIIELNSLLVDTSIKCAISIEHKLNIFRKPSLGLHDSVVHYIIIGEYVFQALDVHVNRVFKMIRLYQEVNCH